MFVLIIDPVQPSINTGMFNKGIRNSCLACRLYHDNILWFVLFLINLFL